jgi:GNAT superfamily N-acetyltransferase
MKPRRSFRRQKIEMMMTATISRGVIRKLFATDLPLFREHLLRLDPETRRSRFVGSVDDDYLAGHAERCFANGGIIIAYVVDGAVRGVAELLCFDMAGETHAEAAFSVEAAYRRQGIADALFRRLMTTAQNRGVRRLTINCLAKNAAMRALAAKYHAELSFDEGESVGNIVADEPTLRSFVDEAVDDARGFARAAILLQRRLWSAPGAA